MFVHRSKSTYKGTSGSLGVAQEVIRSQDFWQVFFISLIKQILQHDFNSIFNRPNKNKYVNFTFRLYISFN